jgi:hypothetical protein
LFSAPSLPGARYGYQRAIKKTRRNVEGLVDKMHNEISAAEALRRLVTAPTIPIPKRR